MQLLASNPTSAAVGTSAYLISPLGVKHLLQADEAAGGFANKAIPNVMAEVFPQTRFATYPMLFHRAGRVSSLVNPQLDDFRRVMFTPAMYSLWERLMVGTALEVSCKTDKYIYIGWYLYCICY